MNALNRSVLSWMCILLATPAFATGRASPKQDSAAASPPDAKHYAHRCQGHTPDRGIQPQGTLLWGTRQTWREGAQDGHAGSSVLVSVDLGGEVSKANPSITALRLDKGHLEASPQPSIPLVGTVLKGISSDGKPVEVALCGAEPSAEDPSMVWYRIEAWNPVAQEWENPCVATPRVPDPRALAVSGVWDVSGAHHDAQGRFTLACENGVISKCITWGYKPWATRDGLSLASVHQACTRMARADYCGDGRSHTHDGTTIDMYDRYGMLVRTTQTSVDWDPNRASFEAAWAPDGATCLARTRDGRALETVLQECPGRFRTVAADLGDGDRCVVQRVSVSPETYLLRNRSYGALHGTATQARNP
ncbi:ADYC domain-containing protein [Hyalangium versicolor]|uniref:ADYC domain-containing protein n=1 Tax=Hyalangium versicolor TaxID=2861190 RepID=UPI001CCA3308|nr:ADYC domain-containing protein [Hyalangium versicolor]